MASKKVTTMNVLSFGCQYRQQFKPKTDSLNRVRAYISTESVDFEGRSISRTVNKMDNPKTRYNGLKASDFCLENVLAVGAPLAPSSYVPQVSTAEEISFRIVESLQKSVLNNGDTNHVQSGSAGQATGE